MIVKWLHSVRDVIVKRQMPIDGVIEDIDCLQTRYNGFSKFYLPTFWWCIGELCDQLLCVSDQCLDLRWIQKQIIFQMPPLAQFDRLLISLSDDRSMDIYICVSSAYWWQVTMNTEMRRLTGEVKIVGPVRSVSTIRPESPNRSVARFSRRSWFNVSDAALISNDRSTVGFPLLAAASNSLTILIITVSV